MPQDSATSRSLRYVFPGLGATLILAVLVSISPGWSEFQEALPEKSSAWTAAVLAALVGSGGIGYLASQLYFCLHWRGPREFGPVNHRVSADAIVAGYPLWRTCPGTEIDPDRRDWVIVTTWWWLIMGRNNAVSSVEPRATRLIELSHSSGILGAAILIVWMAWFLTSLLGGWCSWTGSALGLALLSGVQALLLWNCSKTRAMHERLVELVVHDALSSEGRYPPPDEIPIACEDAS